MDKKPWEFDAVSFLEAERRRNQEIAKYSGILNKEKERIKDLSASILPKRNYRLIPLSSVMGLPEEDPRCQYKHIIVYDDE